MHVKFHKLKFQNSEFRMRTSKLSIYDRVYLFDETNWVNQNWLVRTIFSVW